MSIPDPDDMRQQQGAKVPQCGEILPRDTLVDSPQKDKRVDEMTFADYQRGARKVVEGDHKGMYLK